MTGKRGTNNYQGIAAGSPYNETSFCSNEIPPTPGDTCTINNGGNIDVNFGQLERSDMTPEGNSRTGQDKTFTISCTGSNTVDYTVQLQSTPATWNGDAIQSSNGSVGVKMTWDGTTMTNGTRKQMAVNGSATANLTFVPVRSPAVSSDQIATGGFSASATLIVTKQ
ncbi:TPA: fimbrial protein [Klebsiella aerogenes]|nr:fimbrial protein [Klebsiella aerogenes]